MTLSYPDNLIIGVKVFKSRPLLMKTHQSLTGLKRGQVLHLHTLGGIWDVH